MCERQVVVEKDEFVRMKESGVIAGSSSNTLQCANYLLKVSFETTETFRRSCMPIEETRNRQKRNLKYLR